MSATIHKLIPNNQPGEDFIRVPEGVYNLAYTHHITWRYMGRYPKLVICFTIQDFGEYYLLPVNSYYNLKKIQGKPKRNGHFTAGKRSDFVLDYTVCFDIPARLDRISMCRFKNAIVQAHIRTVTHNRMQREYPEGLQYSVIDHIIGANRI